MIFASDSYRTIQAPTQSLFRDKGSKFLGFSFPINSEQQVKEIITSLRKEHPAANHVCYAFFIGPNQEGYRTNDDGEPAGTAGKPILNQLKSYQITYVLVAVVRYFGGTLLGVSGLINAYKQAAKLSLDKAIITERFVLEEYNLITNYVGYNSVLRKLNQFSAQILNQELGLEVSCTFAIRKSVAEELIKQLSLIEQTKITYKKTI